MPKGVFMIYPNRDLILRLAQYDGAIAQCLSRWRHGYIEWFDAVRLIFDVINSSNETLRQKVNEMGFNIQPAPYSQEYWQSAEGSGLIEDRSLEMEAKLIRGIELAMTYRKMLMNLLEQNMRHSVQPIVIKEGDPFYERAIALMEDQTREQLEQEEG